MAKEVQLSGNSIPFFEVEAVWPPNLRNLGLALGHSVVAAVPRFAYMRAMVIATN